MGREQRDARVEAAKICSTRDDQMAVASPAADKLPAGVREYLGEIRALVGISDLTRLAAIHRIQRVKEECLARRISWEQVCEETMPKCRRSIDHYLVTLETFGDGMYEPIIEITSKAERIQARRLLKGGKLRLDGDCIVINDQRVRNVPEEAHTILELIRESMAREEAAKADAATEKDLRKRQAEAAAKREQRDHELLDAKDAELDRWKGTPAPVGLKTEAERRAFARLLTWQIDQDAKANGIMGLLTERDHGGVFWFEVATWLSRQRKVWDELLKRCLVAHGDSFAETGLRAPMVHLEIPTGDWEQRGGAALAAAISAAEPTNRHGQG